MEHAPYNFSQREQDVPLFVWLELPETQCNFHRQTCTVKSRTVIRKFVVCADLQVHTAVYKPSNYLLSLICKKISERRWLDLLSLILLLLAGVAVRLRRPKTFLLSATWASSSWGTIRHSEASRHIWLFPWVSSGWNMSRTQHQGNMQEVSQLSEIAPLDMKKQWLCWVPLEWLRESPETLQRKHTCSWPKAHGHRWV